MIFGKTTNDKRHEESLSAIRKALGVKRFAFLPRRLYDGQYVFWQHYYQYYNFYVSDKGNGFFTISQYGEPNTRYLTSNIDETRHLSIADKELLKKHAKLHGIILSES